MSSPGSWFAADARTNPPNSPAQGTIRQHTQGTHRSQTTSFGFLASVPVVYEQEVGRDVDCESNRFLLAFVQIHVWAERSDRLSNFQPVRTLAHPGAHGAGCARLAQLADDSGWDQNPFVQRRQ
ncbi:hypothetical protein SBA4_3230008 [Candidatus Sulfopaludibacter sp. SbA4]|nr:hypothetical protein SBA4_3230008 [Candidatus Sulfopaludibacter sp. SbA4]